MAAIKNISIPQPCHQSWDNMSEAQGGRHCQACSKTVIDFTGMSNQQIIDILTNRSNVCGRIDAWQVDSVNRQLAFKPQSRFSLKRWILAASVLFALPVFKAQARQTSVNIPALKDTIIKRNKPVIYHSKNKPKAGKIIKPLRVVQVKIQKDSLKAYAACFKLVDISIDTTKIKPALIEQALTGFLGGVQVGVAIKTVERPAVMTSIYDWLRQL